MTWAYVHQGSRLFAGLFQVSIEIQQARHCDLEVDQCSQRQLHSVVLTRVWKIHLFCFIVFTNFEVASFYIYDTTRELVLAGGYIACVSIDLGPFSGGIETVKDKYITKI